MDAKELVTTLSNDELAQRLKALKEDIGPITPTTRPLYEKRLLRCLLLEQASTCTIPYSRLADGEITGTASGGDGKVPGNVTALEGTANSVATERPVVDDPEGTTFYGVQLQTEAAAINGYYVFTNKDEAIKLIKERKGGRFKAFSKRSEAEEFSRSAGNTATAIPSTPTGVPLQGSVVPARPVPSESSSFRSLKFQELLPFRRAIECEDIETIRSLVWSNPRFLIGSGDNPTILHEGSRYNALHICATKNKPVSCKLILDTIEDPKLAELLYPDDTEETRKSRIDFFTDLYLNTPDKHLGETPLHFACKYGFIEMVAVLVSHPGTDKQLKNVEGRTPREVICSRVRNASDDLKQKIIALFDNLYYVRVVGSTDNSCPARVLPPWSPCVRLSATDDAVFPCSPLKNCIQNSPAHGGTPRDLPVAVKAFAGPMSAVQAEQFHNVWVASPGSMTKERRRQYAQIRRGDCVKGVERIGREISRKMNVPWCEYWEFLDCLIDLETPDGLHKLEDHLRHRLKDALEVRKREQALRDASICQLMDDLNINSSSSILCSSTPERRNGVREDAARVNPEAIITWPPSLARILDEDVAKVETVAKGGGDTCVGVKSAVNPDAEKPDVVAETNGADADEAASDASSSSFHTADDDLDLDYSLVSEWPEDFDGFDSVDPVFVYGEKPCQTDVDVLRALETAVICPTDYPLVFRWRNAVLSYPDDVRSRWVPHERLKQATSTPCHSLSSSHEQSFNLNDTSTCSQPDVETSLSDFDERSLRVTLWH